MKSFRFVSLMILTVVFLLVNQPAYAFFISDDFGVTTNMTGWMMRADYRVRPVFIPGVNNTTDWKSGEMPYYGSSYYLVPGISDGGHTYDNACSLSPTPINIVTPMNCVFGRSGRLVFLDGFVTTQPPDVTPQTTSIFLLGAGLLGLVGFGQIKRRYQILTIFDYNH